MSATESPDELIARLQIERQAVEQQARYQQRAVPHTAVAITGSRGHTPTREELNAFWALFDRVDGVELHHGDEQGVDRGVAIAFHRSRPELKIVAHPADWGRLGKSAGPIRNQDMMRAAGILIAWPGGRGTESCVRIARDLGRPVYFIADEVDRRRLDIERDFI